MDNRKYITAQILTVLAGEVFFSTLMVGVFAISGRLDRSVVLGALAGSLIATLNHAFLILVVFAASAKAENQDVKGGQALVRISCAGRLIALFLVLVLCAKSGIFHPIALTVPLIFTRPILTVADLLKKGGNEA